MAAIVSTGRACPARTAEWQARVAASRSRAPVTSHSPEPRSWKSRRSASSAAAGSRPASSAGTERRLHRSAPERLHVVAQRVQGLRVGLQQGQQRGRQGHDLGGQEQLRLAATGDRRAASDALVADPLVGRVLVHEQQLLAVGGHDVGVAVLAQDPQLAAGLSARRRRRGPGIELGRVTLRSATREVPRPPEVPRRRPRVDVSHGPALGRRPGRPRPHSR